MNIFTSLPFLKDFPSSRPAANSANSYARGYGNRVASAELFAPLGHGHGSDNDNDTAPEQATRRIPGAGTRSPAVFAHDPCPVGACG